MKTSLLLLALVMLILPARSQPFHYNATKKDENGQVAITSEGARALLNIITYLRQDNDWKLSFEDPIYNNDYETYDASTSSVKVREFNSFPTFSATFPELSKAKLATDDGLEEVVKKVLEEYNSSEFLGYYELQKIGPGNYSVVGRGNKRGPGQIVRQPALLDTTVSLSPGERSLGDAIAEIFNQLTEKTGIVIDFAALAGNLTLVQVNVSGEQIPARNLMSQVYDASGKDFITDTLYDTAGGYLVNISPVFHVTKDEKGHEHRTEREGLGRAK